MLAPQLVPSALTSSVPVILQFPTEALRPVRSLRNMASESITNRKALRDYRILDRYEAGIELKGSEVKSIRGGKANISDAFARIENGEAFLYNADIQPYERASHEIPPAKRVRKLLLHRQEIDKLYGE